MRDRADYMAYVGARRVAYLLCRDWAHAEDLAQTALTEVWRVWWRVGDRPGPRVYRALANTHASCRSRRWRGEVPTEWFADVPDSNDRTSTAETRTVLWTPLGRLPPRQRHRGAASLMPVEGPASAIATSAPPALVGARAVLVAFGGVRAKPVPLIRSRLIKLSRRPAGRPLQLPRRR